MTRRPFRFLVCVLALASAGSASAQSAALEAALAAGKVSGQLNLRYEGVKEDNALDSAEALTLRSALKYSTAGWRGFSAVVEVEDVRSLGIDNYAVPVTGFNSGRYSVIADPETTELNQAYLQYLQGGFTARLGRQDLRYDDQRMIGAVPWRQDYQSFDALSLSYQQAGHAACLPGLGRPVPEHAARRHRRLVPQHRACPGRRHAEPHLSQLQCCREQSGRVGSR
jgi:hypothetical protein